MDFCVRLRDDDTLVSDGIVKCWILDMNEFVKYESEGLKELPLDNEDDFNYYLGRFVIEDENGRDYTQALSLGFDAKT